METTTNTNPWILAARPRTLPLALSSVLMGSFLAAVAGKFDLGVALLCAITTVFLQILSNLANDYGDSIHGADSPQRVGPSRAVQAGAITPQAMLRAIIICGAFAFCSGVFLLYYAIGLNWKLLGFFLALGVACILAAILYTNGKKPYGYAGLGDISVLIFFGLVGVLGTEFLHTKAFNAYMVLPALSCGFFSMGVLNINNLRDRISDKAAGKNSVPVRIGAKAGRIYHVLLIAGGWVCAFAFTATVQPFNLFNYLFVLTLPLFLVQTVKVFNNTADGELDPFLKQLAISTLLFVATFGVGLMIGKALVWD